MLCGNVTLGTNTVSGTEDTDFEKRLPPMMASQLDQIVIQEILQPLQKKLVQGLQTLIDNHRPDTWLEIYLAAFVLLNHTAMSSIHGRRFAKNYGLEVRSTQSLI